MTRGVLEDLKKTMNSLKEKTEIFGKQAVLDIFLSKINHYDNRLKELYQIKKRIKELYRDSCDNEEWFYDLLFEKHKQEVDKAEEKLSRWKYKYNVVKYPNKKRKKEYDIDALKKVPLEKVIPLPIQIKSYNTLKYKCPFHKNGSERTGSLTVYVKNNNYYCFGCGLNGDTISFVMKYNGYNFLEACEYLENLA